MSHNTVHPAVTYGATAATVLFVLNAAKETVWNQEDFDAATSLYAAAFFAFLSEATKNIQTDVSLKNLEGVQYLVKGAAIPFAIMGLKSLFGLSLIWTVLSFGLAYSTFMAGESVSVFAKRHLEVIRGN